MTQALEKVVVDLAFGKDPDKCPFSHESDKQSASNTNDWSNNSAALGADIKKKHSKEKDLPNKTKVKSKVWPLKYNAHHIIPADDSWPKTKLKDWIDAEAGLVCDDIGYDVNCAENGINLPSSDALHGGRWKIEHGVSPNFQRDYAFAAIEANRPIRQFHDSHKPYSALVTKMLDKMAEKLEATPSRDMGCGHKNCFPGKKKPFETPKMLDRIHAASKRLATYLRGGPAHWKSPIVTSKFSLMYKKTSLSAKDAAGVLRDARRELRKLK